MKGFQNVRAVIGNEIKTVNIAFSSDGILAVGEDVRIDEPIPVSGTVLPGWIDQHIHGANGCDTMDADKSGLQSMANALVQEGVTAFLPTTMTAGADKISRAVECVRDFMNTQNNGATALGVHLEGPFISPDKCGAQPKEYVLSPKDFPSFNVNLDGVRLMTVAPERDGAEELIKTLVSRGVAVSAGHTTATSKEFENGVSAGMTCTTHTFNAMSGLNHREVGVAGKAMLLDVYNELILDGEHVSFDAARILTKMKKDKIVFITDAMRAKGSGDGESELGGQKVFVKNGRATLADGTLAGSVLTMETAVKNAISKLGFTLADVARSASENPAKVLGLYPLYGKIAVGGKANFTVVKDDGTVECTVVNGKVYEKSR